MLFDDLLGDRQADARAFEPVLRMQTLEQREDTGEVFFVKTNSIVAYADQTKRPALRFGRTKTANTQAFGVDVDPRRQIDTRELQGIAEDILKHLSDLPFVDDHGWQGAYRYHRLFFFDDQFKVLDQLDRKSVV